jgi:uncharacterized protein involved in response to NO
MYALTQLGMIARFAAAKTGDSPRDNLLIVAAVAWVGAFALYLIVYGPYLMTARIDGREG